MFQRRFGKKNEEGGSAAEPDPGAEEDAALGREQKSDDNAEDEKGDGIFLLQADAGDDAEPEPILRLIVA